jgi:hypothetical protein
VSLNDYERKRCRKRKRKALTRTWVRLSTERFARRSSIHDKAQTLLDRVVAMLSAMIRH